MNILPYSFQRLIQVRLAVLVIVVLTLAMIPQGARAASSWSPTLLVNTEAFQVIDDGDGSSNIELRFGGTANEILRWNVSKSAFVFTDDLNVEGNLTASGTLSVEGASSLQGNVTVTGTVDTTGNITTDGNLEINEDNGNADAVFTFGSDGTDETLTWVNSNDVFQLSDDLSITGTLSASGSASLESSLDVGGAISGATIHAEGSLSASGTLFLQGTLTGALSFHGPFTSDCDDATNSKLLWDSSTGKFSCGTDQSAASGLSMSDADARYVNQSGDTMTGNLVIGNAKTLSVSGAVVTEGNLTINEDADSNNAVLTFGSDTTNENITWQNTGDRFEFSDDIATTGSINASGAIVTDAGLTVGTTTTFGGVAYSWPSAIAAQSGHLLSVNPTTGQLTWTSGRSSSGSIVSLNPEYDGAVYFSSGGSFVGQLSGSSALALSGTPENFYHWTTSRTTNQDYWISTRVRIPSNFRSWDPIAPIQFRYRGSGGTLDVRLLDTSDAPVVLTGGQDLKNSTFTTATITGPQAAGTYAVDDYITLLVKLTASGSALNDEFADAGLIELNWETKD